MTKPDHSLSDGEGGHTPGPWEVHAYNDGSFSIDPRFGLNSGHVIVGLDAMSGPDASANARLISAAPDLLEALKAAFCSIVGRVTYAKMAASGWQWPDEAPEHVSIVAEHARAAIAKAEAAS